MHIDLRQFKEGEKRSVENNYDAKELDLEFVDMKYAKPLELKATIEKGPNSLTFKGLLRSEVERVCARCLKSVRDNVSRDFELYYEIKDKDEIETINDLREVLILDHPLSFVCQGNCRGLCPHCGTNLNESHCDCTERARSNSFLVLKEFWNKNRGEEPNGTS